MNINENEFTELLSRYEPDVFFRLLKKKMETNTKYKRMLVSNNTKHFSERYVIGYTLEQKPIAIKINSLEKYLDNKQVEITVYEYCKGIDVNE